MRICNLKIYKRLLFNKIITYLYIAYIFTPILYQNIYLGLVLFILWFATCSLNKQTMKSIIGYKSNLCVYLWVIYAFIMRIIGFSKAAWGNYFIMIMFFFPIIIYNMQDSIWTLKEKNNLIKFSILVISLNLLDNIRLIIKYPNITKEMNFVSNFNMLNIGDTIYSLVLTIFTIIIMWIYINKNRNIRLLVILIMGLIYPILAGKTTAMLILYTCIILMVIRKSFEKLNKKIVISISVILLIVGFLIVPNILEFISNNVDNQSIAERINAIYKLDFNSIYFERINLGIMSLETFTKNPILGIGNQKVELNGSLINVYKSGIGHHSELIDHLARYGIIGIIFYYMILVQYLNQMKKVCVNKSDNDLKLIVLTAFIIFSIMNNSFIAPVGMLVFMILPYIIQVYSKSKEVVK